MPGKCPSKGRGAIGSNGVVASCELWRQHAQGIRALHDMWVEHLATMAACSRFPWQYNLYHAWFLDKNNGKHGCPSLRVIFGLLSVAKVMLSVLFEEAMPDSDASVPDFFSMFQDSVIPSMLEKYVVRTHIPDISTMDMRCVLLGSNLTRRIDYARTTPQCHCRHARLIFFD